MSGTTGSNLDGDFNIVCCFTLFVNAYKAGYLVGFDAAEHTPPTYRGVAIPTIWSKGPCREPEARPGGAQIIK